MRICIVSDSHDRAPMLAAAVSAARQAGAQAVVHCGDVIGAGTLKPLLALG
ncbi:MAG: metallophosphoesterase, partial [Burkholderiales bacterium]